MSDTNLPKQQLYECPRCRRTMAFYLRTLPRAEGQAGHRIYRCEQCHRFEWIAEQPGGSRCTEAAYLAVLHGG
jgi:DNA-directed RNA polymerase subunit M/transcription elongation factor TFIIS